ncbi:MAG: D-alanyl-D-alanine carboxypeptidase/D-alanyl-D-alanine endopeptidase [Prochlorothrix sp.]
MARRALGRLLLGTVLGVLAPIASPAQAQCPVQLSTRIPALFEAPAVARSHWGLTVATETGTVLYDHQGDRFFTPASVQKLLTTAAALTVLGPDYTRSTTVTLAGASDPQLILTGAGDPAFSRDDLAQLAQTTAQQLQLRGIETVTHLWGEESLSHGTQTPSTWEFADTQAGYGAPLNSLMLTQNALPLVLHPRGVGEPLRLEWENPRDGLGWAVANRSRSGGPEEREWVRVGQSLREPIVEIQGLLRSGAPSEPVAIAALAPGERFLTEFAAALDRSGIRVQNQALIDPTGVGLVPSDWAGESLATYPSPSVAQLVATANQTSQNLYAEALVQWLGQPLALGPGGVGSAANTGANVPANPESNPRGVPWEQGLDRLEATLVNLGIPGDQMVLADGSGLSRRNLLTPRATVALLQALARSPHQTTYRQSLAIAGERGTLRWRFQGTNLEGRFQGKTGSMTGIYALAGYVQPPQFEPIVFSAFINHADASYGTLRQTLEAVVLELGQLQSCGPQ